MKIAISSGKGGTGKTFIATNLSWLAAQRGTAVTYLDCDVEAPNGHLFMKPEITSVEKKSVLTPVRFDEEKCTACGKCVNNCHYNALALVRDKVLFFPELCHACGACTVACPNDAVIEGDTEIGELKHGKSGAIDFHYGLLKTGAGGMSPRLIHDLKESTGPDLTILDSPPGTACSTVETVKGADLALLVSDPTPFSIHDLKLSVNMCRELGQEPAVVVNRAGLDDTALRAYCAEAQLEVVGAIPDAREIAEVYSVGDLVAEKLPKYQACFGEILDNALALAARKRPARTDLIVPLFKTGGKPARASQPNPDAKRPPEIAVVSGKGGTGKTSITACFAQLAENGVIADCDVDAADLHLLLAPDVVEEGDFIGGISVTIDPEECVGCGKCYNVCRFNAIERLADGKCRIDPNICEGCGACELVCDDLAIESEDAVNGRWFTSNTRFGPMAHAALGVAEENSGRLVTLVRDMAIDLAAEQNRSDVVVMDGSPGTGCPVIASLTGARYAVVVTEPTVSGLHDLDRILNLTRHFGVETGVVVNKADLNLDMAEKIDAVTQELGATPLGRVPYDAAFTQAQLQVQTLLENGDSEAGRLVSEIWKKVMARVQGRSGCCAGNGVNSAPAASALSRVRDEVHPRCVVCSRDNPHGLRLNFVPSEKGGVEAAVYCDELLQGYRGCLHGGVVATLLDGAMANCLFARGAADVTAELNIRFLHPVETARRASVRAWVAETAPLMYVLHAEVVQEGLVKATAEGKFMRPGSSPV